MKFLRSQVIRAVVQHRRFCTALETHEQRGDDDRLRALCEHFGAPMLVHQRALEAYGESIDSGASTRASIEESDIPAGAALEPAADRNASDFDRLAADLLMSRQAQDTFTMFRESGHVLGDTELERMGDLGAREHYAYAGVARRLLLRMFLENVEDDAPPALSDLPGVAPRPSDLPESHPP